MDKAREMMITPILTNINVAGKWVKTVMMKIKCKTKKKLYVSITIN